MVFLDVPKKSPLLLKPVIFIAERIVGKALPLARFLSLRPMVAFVSALLELSVERAVRILPKRLGIIVRLTASFISACPFCIDLNSAGYEKSGLTLENLKVLQKACMEYDNKMDLFKTDLPGFSLKEKAAWAYAAAASSSPLYFPLEVLELVKKYFSVQKIVTLAAVVAKVNYWARLSQALGIRSLGVSECQLVTPDN